MSVDVEVRAACPGCGSNETTRRGQVGNVIYRRCNQCGVTFKALRYTAEEVDVIVLRDGTRIDLRGFEQRITRLFQAVVKRAERL